MGKMNGERYMGNINKKEVHDLDNEKIGCEKDKILKNGHEKPFKTFDEVPRPEYDNCAHCLGNSKR